MRVELGPLSRGKASPSPLSHTEPISGRQDAEPSFSHCRPSKAQAQAGRRLDAGNSKLAVPGLCCIPIIALGWREPGRQRDPLVIPLGTAEAPARAGVGGTSPGTGF